MFLLVILLDYSNTKTILKVLCKSEFFKRLSWDLFFQESINIPAKCVAYMQALEYVNDSALIYLEKIELGF